MLDFARLVPQIGGMLDTHAQLRASQVGGDLAAVEALRSAESDWQQLARQARNVGGWLVGVPCEPPGLAAGPPPTPVAHTVLAVDGSQIKPDRHEIVDCFLLNVGLVSIRYGENSFARLWSEPALHYHDEDLFPIIQGERAPLTDRRLSIRRMQAEFAALRRLIDDLTDSDLPAVALVDGTLILWTLEAEPIELQARVIADFQSMLAAARSRGVPVAGYISRPGSSDVTNLLRASLCGFDGAACGLKCGSQPSLRTGSSPCKPLDRITDRVLFERALKDGERSALFESLSKVLKSYSTENRTRFFYLHAGWEAARLEVPQWVADSPEMLARVHAVALDQARKGGGYPRALTEAHEQAVIRAADRAAFFELVERQLVRARLPVAATQKALAKRMRGV